MLLTLNMLISLIEASVYKLLDKRKFYLLFFSVSVRCINTIKFIRIYRSMSNGGVCGRLCERRLAADTIK